MCTHEVHVICVRAHARTHTHTHTHEVHVMCTHIRYMLLAHTHMRYMLCAHTWGTCYVHKLDTSYMHTHTQRYMLCEHTRYHLTQWWWLFTPFINSPRHPRMNEETNKITTLYIMNLPVLWFEQYTQADFFLVINQTHYLTKFILS